MPTPTDLKRSQSHNGPRNNFMPTPTNLKRSQSHNGPRNDFMPTPTDLKVTKGRGTILCQRQPDRKVTKDATLSNQKFSTERKSGGAEWNWEGNA